MKTKFSEEEMTQLCQILKKHGTDCGTLEDMLYIFNRSMPNDAISTFKHVRLLKEFGVIDDRVILCHVCVSDVINNHAVTCKDYKRVMRSDYPIGCPDSHYDYSRCESAVWMVDCHEVYKLEKIEADKIYKNGNTKGVCFVDGVPDRLDFSERSRFLEEKFPDIPKDVRFNPSFGFLCDKHIGSMKKYANKIIGYVNEKER
jgi:hypothetical protein